MDLKTLWENFDVIAEAENGIQKLHKLILNLALQGKLTQTKAKYLNTDLLEQKVTEPYSIPDDWKWTKIGDVADIKSGFAFKSKDYCQNGTFIVRVTNIADNGSIGEGEKVYFPTNKIDKKINNYYLKANDILLVMVGGSLGKIGLVKENNLPALLNQNIWRFRNKSNHVKASFLRLALKNLIQNRLSITQSTHGHLTKSKFKAQMIPLPPFEEQNRIVNKVNELMELCDRAQASKENRNELRQQLRQSAIHALETAETEEEFNKSWHFVRDNWQDLTLNNQDTTNLRRLILLTAARGQLVSHEEANGSAEEVFLRAIEEKKALSEEGLIPKPKKISPISEKETPFRLPNSWKWVRLESICNYIVDCPHRTPKYSSEGYPAIRTSEMTPGKILIEKARKVSKEEYDKQTQRLVPKPGDIFYSREGNFGIAAVVPEGVKICLSQRMMQFRTASVVDPFYFSLIMNSPVIFDQAARDALGMTVPHINIRSLKQFVFPLAPLEEQKRIVTKVNELMKICDRVEKNLSKKEELANQISASVIHHLDI
jgi:type I restriction enzyme S subunit